MTNTVLGSQNKEWGFYGTVNNYYPTESKINNVWAETFKTLMELSDKQPEEIRDYLDSRSGRKLADCIIDSRDDLKTTVTKEYIKWVEFDLFRCNKNDFTVTSKILFGTTVHDDVNNKYVIILSEDKIKGMKFDYLKVMDSNENKYIIKRDFLTPIEK